MVIPDRSMGISLSFNCAGTMYCRLIKYKNNLLFANVLICRKGAVRREEEDPVKQGFPSAVLPAMFQTDILSSILAQAFCFGDGYL